MLDQRMTKAVICEMDCSKRCCSCQICLLRVP